MVNVDIDKLVLIAKYVLLKGVAVGLYVLSTSISKGFMTQIFVEKVYIRDENPQKLWIGNAITSILCALFIAVVIGFVYILNISEITEVNDLVPIVVDMVMSLLITSLIGWIISSVMYKKKYFSYKDEGLRAIRAFNQMMRLISIVVFSVPYATMTVMLV
jgi:hypothetical protein